MQKNQWRLAIARLVIGSLFIGFRAFAQDQNPQGTNNMGLMTAPITLDFGFGSKKSSDDFVGRFGQEIRERHSIGDGFGPQSGLGWFRAGQTLRYRTWDLWNSAGMSSVKSVMSDSARETAVAFFQPGIDRLEERGEVIGDSVGDWILGKTSGTFLHGFFKLFTGSLGNTDEERMHDEPVPVSPNFMEVRESWFTQVERDNEIKYGLRPFRDHPYGYIASSVGHYGGLPIMIIEAQVGYGFPNRITFKGDAALPLPWSSRLEIGISAEPMRIWRGNSENTSLFAQLIRIGNRRSVFFAGVSANFWERAIQLGYTRQF
jgi:hypothetical protein